MVCACDDPIPNIRGKHMVSRVDLLFGGVVDVASKRLEVVSFSSFSLVLVLYRNDQFRFVLL